MKLSEAEILTRPEIIALIERVNTSLPNPLPDSALVASISALRAEGHAAEIVQTVMAQVKLRRKAALKFSSANIPELLTRDGLEQATRESVADVHAERFVQAGIQHIADLGSGIGADALAFARAGLSVTAVERDPATVLLTRHNMSAYVNTSVICADAETFDASSVDSLWFDPARRQMSRGEMKRNIDPSSWSPSLDYVFEQARRTPVGIKLSPALDHALIPEGVEAQWVSDRGEVVELALWSGILARPGVGRAALVLDHGRSELTASGPSVDEPVAESLKEFLYEPNGAVIRAGLVGKLARMIKAQPVSEQIAYLTGSEAIVTPFAQGFRIVAVLSARAEKLRVELKSRNIGVLEIKKRGIDIDPAIFRKKLKLSGKRSATLILTRVAGAHQALLVERLSSDG